MTIGLGVTGLVCGISFCSSAQQVIRGQPGRADAHAVVNFRGMAELDRLYGLGTNLGPRAVHAPYPLRQGFTNPPAGGAPTGANAPAGNTFSAAGGPPPPPSPPPTATFPALLDNGAVIPPDTDGAVGTNHVMTALNSQIRIQDKNGVIISTVSLGTFWQALRPRRVFDPHVVYDPYANRWIFTVAADSFLPTASVLLAVSQTGDPTGNWFLYRVDADRNNVDWADYPGLGFNKDWIVVTVNMFPIFGTNVIGFSGVNIYAFNKTNLYANGSGLFTFLRDGSTIGFTMVPTVTFDDNLPVMHLVEVDNLFHDFTGISSRLRISTVTGPVGAEVLTLGSGFTTATNDWASSEPNSFFGGFAPQLGSPFLIENGDSRIINAIYRSGSLWCTHTVFLPATLPSHSAVQWWQLATNGATIQFGRIEDTQGQIYYAYPSIAVNRNEDALLGFSRFSASQYASANYAFRSCQDPPNTFRTDFLLKDGEAPYYKTFFLSNIFGISGPNRWGDYSATVVDPVNDFDMWTLQEYASTPDLSNPFFPDRWGTWWGRVTPVETCFRIAFQSPFYSVNEADPEFAVISVLNLGGAPGTVDWATADGTGLAGVDYLPRKATLTFAAGQTETNFVVVLLDNAVVNSNKTVRLTLSNPTGIATLGQITNATLTIVDDETILQGSEAGEFNFSSYLNNGVFYLGSEFEGNFIFPCVNQRYTFFGPERDAPGILVTVIRTNGISGRVMVDFDTPEGGGAVPFVDYTPVSGTLVFDDGQMSTNFLVEVFPESFFTFLSTGTRFIRVVLSNPRAAPEEEAERPGTIRPKLGLGSESGILLYDSSLSLVATIIGGVFAVGVTNNAFAFERNNWRVDEYPSPNAVGGVRPYNVQVLKPDGMGGRVIFRTRERPGGATIFSPSFLKAGSDFAEAPEPGGFVGIQGWPNPLFTDPNTPPITNYSDYLGTNTILTFGNNQCRQNVTLWITNNSEVEFNEDIMLELVQIIGEPPVNLFADIASLTILYNDQPAGALDREWNPWNIPGSDPPLNTTPGANNIVRTLVVQPDGKTILGGDFDHVNAVRRPGIARLGTNGALDRVFDPGNGVDGFVTSLSLYSTNSPNSGKVLVGGGFSSFDGTQRNGIARLLPSGQLDPSFFPGTGADGPIWGLALQADEKVVVVGSFTQFNDTPRNGVARLDADGSLDVDFDVGTGADSTVWAVGIVADPLGDKIMVGGDFSSFNGIFSGGVARLNPDGSLDQSFQTGSGANGSVYALAVQTNGLVIIAGSFSEIDAKTRVNIARFNTDGSLDPNFDPGFGPDNIILTVALQPDGKALIGGPFTSYNSTRRMGFARLRANGTLDTTFLDTAYNQFAGLIKTFSFEPPNYVAAFAVQPDGNIMIGGSFTNIGGNPSIRAPLRNRWTVFTRADKQVRFNIARVFGNATPGPGNAEFDSNEFYADENAGVASIRLQRTDGRLGTLTAFAAANDRVAISNVDYIATNLFETWREGTHGLPFVIDTGPVNVGEVAPVHLRLTLLDDTLQEGDESVDLSFLHPVGSLNLGGELIPLGGALGRAKATLIIADNDVDHGIFNFATPNFFTNENTISAVITVVRTNGSVGSASVDYYTRNSTNTPIASVNVDYRPARGTLFFASGQTSRTFTVPIIDDNVVEFDENIELVLTNATGGAKMPGRLPTSIATSTLTIIDNDFPAGRLNFALASFTTNENAGVALIAVTRTGGNLGAISVQYTTLDGTATAPADYVNTSGTLSWDDADSNTRFFSVPLVADGIVDDPSSRFETIGLRLLNPRVGTVSNPGLLGVRTNATLVIEDSDAYGTLAFSQSFYQADENGGAATVTIVRKNGLAGNVSADISLLPVDPLSPGVDYVPTGGTISFLPGESSKPFTIQLLDDAEPDGNKDLVLTLSNPVNASLGLPNPVTLTLIDNESFNLPAGELDTSFSTNAQANGPVYSIALQPDGRVLMAGDFTEVNHVLRTGVARLGNDGLLDPSFNPGAGPNGSVRVLSLQPDGKMLVGGFFSQFNGTNRNAIVRLNPDGTVDSAFNPGAGANNPIYAIALQPNDKILVGGAFNTFNSITRPGIVRLNTNGIVDPNFNTGSGANSTVYAVALQSDGKVIIGGDFTVFNGQPRTRLARLNPNGSLDASFDPNASLDSTVRAILVQPDGRILVGGTFTSADGVPRNYLARFNVNGSLDTGFLADPLPGADNSVYALAQQVDGRILVAGDFRRFNDVTRNRLTRLNPDGTTDPTINFGNGTDSFVATLAVQPDRKILIGGGFSSYDDKPRLHIARLHGGSIAGAGALEFAAAEFLAQENQTNAMITVRRRYGTTGTAGVDFRTVDGTALAGVNYEATSGTLTFVQGETRQSFLVPILNNSVTNEDLRLSLELLDNTFTGGATNGPQPVARLVILDDEGSISFAADSYSVGENVASGVAPILLLRHGGTNNPVTVDFRTADGTASAFSDYFPTNGTITFLPGETSKLFHVRIVNDTNIEPNETVQLTLSNPSRSNVLGIATATLVIADNDFASGQFVFSQASYSAAENATNVFLTILRTNGTTGVASVRYRTVDNTTTAGADYVGTNVILTFADGEGAKTIAVSILDDLLVESSEFFNVQLSNPTGGAIIGAPSSATVTILDDDISLIIPAGSSLISESISPPNNIIDPNETVTLALGLRNIGSGDTSNLVATLLAGNGVTLPSAPQTYGVLLANGPALAQQFSFKAVGNVGDRLVATLLLTDGPFTNGSATFAFTLGGQASRSFGNTNRITINDNAPASPYPSTINVANMGGTVTKVSVTISNLTHTFPADLDLLLVAPGGEKVMLMSDAGGTAAQPHPVNNVTITFDASAANPIPATNQITSGTYQPANYAGLGTADSFPPPGPALPYTNSALTVLNGTLPNGNWSLFVVDDTSGDAGSIGGWSLSIQTSDPVSSAPALSVADLSMVAQANPSIATVGANLTCVIAVTNHGPATATSVALLDNLPAGVTFVSASASVGTWKIVGGTLTWSVGSLHSGAGATITVASTPTTVGTLANTLLVSANEIDPNFADNSATMWTSVVTAPALSVVRQNNNLQVSWPADSGLKLQFTDSLRPASWTDLGVTPQVRSGQNVLTVAIGGNTRYYRLRSP